MPVTIALAIGFDPWLVESQRTAWRSAGCFVTGVNSVGEAIEQLRCGDFDLILLDPSIPPASRDQVTALVRACGSLIPRLRSQPSCSRQVSECTRLSTSFCC